MTVRHVHIATPLGDFGMLLGPTEAYEPVIVSGFASMKALCAMLPDVQPKMVQAGTPHPYTDAVKRYFDGDLQALASIPKSQPGGRFFQRVWQELRSITPGETATYAQLAARAGSPKAARAAGGACSRNRLALLVPCHRAVPSSRKGMKYLYGADAKRALLAHEARYRS